jgi:hypothetical protein
MFLSDLEVSELDVAVLYCPQSQFVPYDFGFESLGVVRGLTNESFNILLLVFSKNDK